jgi:hypothetical protein
MGKILPYYKKAIIDEIVDNITSGTSNYYAFASMAEDAFSNTTASEVANSDYYTTFTNNWLMLFGKKLTAADIVPFIEKNMWTTNTVYSRYDNTSNTLYTDNNYYVITSPADAGGYYHIYKCIDNNGNTASNTNPSTIGTPTQAYTFETSDGYNWRYISSISSANYDKFSSTDYVPVYANSLIVSSANAYAGVEVLVITNSGNGYNAYTNGTIQSVVNSTLIQISNVGSSTSGSFYVNNAIYINTNTVATSQLLDISGYVANGSGRWITLATAANTTNIAPGVTTYIISPKVKFYSDGVEPQAYTNINTTSNSIGSITLLDIGSDISWCNVEIQSAYGSGAVVYAIAPPAGGHGSNPSVELNNKGVVFGFNFSNTESGTIPTANVVYNKIGIIKNPYTLNANNTKGSLYTSSTFDNLVKATTSYTFTAGQTLIGANSGARGIVVFANSTVVHLAGDNEFVNGEYVTNSTSTANIATITITSIGNLYTKDITPLYVQNINNVNRSNTQIEAFKINIQI